MILADTSIWIDHLRQQNVLFSKLLIDRQILLHPFVLGELALGRVREFNRINQEFQKLPIALVAPLNEVLTLIADHQPGGSGIGYVDAHLLASALAYPETKLWTRDKRLQSVAAGMALAADIEDPLS